MSVGAAIERGASRFTDLPRPAALGIFAMLAAMIFIGLLSPPSIAPPVPKGGATDAALYRAIADRVRHGESYEPAAVAELRARGYALKPVLVSVRPPLLTLLHAWAPSDAAVRLLEALLGAAVIVVWTVRLKGLGPGAPWMAWTALCLFSGVGVAMAGGVASEFHEAWAGLLVAFSLAVRTERRFVFAVALGLVAALVRELAFPYLVVMILFAAIERRRAEAIAFAAALAAALAALAWHAHIVAALVTIGDRTSGGWLSLGGPGFVFATAKFNLMVWRLGVWSAAVIVPLSLLGAGVWKDGAGARLLVLLAGYQTAFLVVGRSDNAYWGFMIAPLVAIGIALAPKALFDLGRRALARS